MQRSKPSTFVERKAWGNPRPKILSYFFMITEILAITSIALAAKADLTKKHFDTREIPNAYFLPIPVLAVLNPYSIPLSLVILTSGLISWQYLGFGLADVLALTTVSLTGYGVDAVIFSVAGILVSQKTVYRKQEKFPALPGIFTGFIIYLIIQAL